MPYPANANSITSDRDMSYEMLVALTNAADEKVKLTRGEDSYVKLVVPDETGRRITASLGQNLGAGAGVGLWEYYDDVTAVTLIWDPLSIISQLPTYFVRPSSINSGGPFEIYTLTSLQSDLATDNTEWDALRTVFNASLRNPPSARYWELVYESLAKLEYIHAFTDYFDPELTYSYFSHDGTTETETTYSGPLSGAATTTPIVLYNDGNSTRFTASLDFTAATKLASTSATAYIQLSASTDSATDYDLGITLDATFEGVADSLEFPEVISPPPFVVGPVYQILSRPGSSIITIDATTGLYGDTGVTALLEGSVTIKPVFRPNWTYAP